MLSEQLLPRLFDKLPHEIDCLGRSLQHFLTEPLSILADLEPWMKFHNLHGVGNKFFVLGQRGEGLSEGRYRLRRRPRWHHGHAAHVPAGNVRGFKRFVLDPRGSLSKNLGVDLGKRGKLGKIRTAFQNSIGAEDIMIINRGDDAGLYQLRFYNPTVARYVFIVILNFVALNGKPCIVTAVVIQSRNRT